MPKHIRKIDHKGDLYYSLDDIIDLLDKSKSIDDLRSMLIPKSDNELSDFNQKLVQGLGFNPKEAKNHFEMIDYPIVGILNNGTETTNLKHPLINRHSVNILKCKTHLYKLNQEGNTIYVDEETNSVYCFIKGKKRIFN